MLPVDPTLGAADMRRMAIAVGLVVARHLRQRNA
jgi:hypothetical protein